MVKFKEAAHYKKLPEKRVRCMLCPHGCVIGNGERGKCNVRMNILGNLKSLNYGKPYNIKYKETENLPLFHFLPKNKVLTVGTAGENLWSKHYDNEVSGKEVEEIPTLDQSAMQIIKQAEKNKVKIISYSESEPSVAFEYANDLFENSKRMKHILVTNGYLEPIPVKEISKKVDAAVINIRSMNESFYENILQGKLDPVLKTAKILHDNNVWVEIKMDLIEGLHNDLYDVRKIASWILNNLDANTPIHFINKMIDPEIAVKARKLCTGAGMNYVYVHGKDFHNGKTTWCPNCKKPLIVREGEQITHLLSDGKCRCGKEIAGIWQ